MKPQMENKHVERILSLIVIMYGLRLIIPNVETIILGILQYGISFDSSSWNYFGYYLINVTVGCLLIIFFPQVVQWIGYFATGGKIRSKRRWFPKEILAVPLILYAFTEFLYVFFYASTILLIISLSLLIDFVFPWDIGNDFMYLPVILVYSGFAMIVLLNARHIAVWLLRVADRKRGLVPSRAK